MNTPAPSPSNNSDSENAATPLAEVIPFDKARATDFDAPPAKYDNVERAITMIPPVLARKSDIVPLGYESGVLYIGSANPKSHSGVAAAIREILDRNRGAQVRIVKLSLELDIIPAIDRIYAAGRIEFDAGSDETVIAYVGRLLEAAIAVGASDIHIHWTSRHFGDIQIFTQGRTRDYEKGRALPAEFLRAVVNRVKIESKLNTSETQLCIDGRISVGKDIGDARVNASPNGYEETDIVIRLLNHHSNILEIAECGLPTKLLAAYLASLEIPYGVVVISGMPGAGKTTTGYATLKHLRSPHRVIVSAEEPIETILPYVRQGPVDVEVGRTFAHIIKSFMRRNVHVAYIGETRDEDTAHTITTISVAGIFCITTIHAINAAGMFERFYEFNVSASALASTLKFSLAQRILKRLCDCRTARTTLTANEARLAKLAGVESAVAYDPSACALCKDDPGFFGRIAIFEGFPINERLRIAIAKKASMAEIARLAIAECEYEPMQLQGYAHAFAGLTTIDEVHRMAGRIDPSFWGKTFA